MYVYTYVRIIGTDVDNDPDMICNVKKGVVNLVSCNRGHTSIEIILHYHLL